jgi:hypothetical protein
MLKVTKISDGQPLLLSTKEIDKIYKNGTEPTVVNYGKGQSITVVESLIAIRNSTGPRDCILVTYKDSPNTAALFFFHNIKSIEKAGTGSRVLFNATTPIVVIDPIAALAAQIAATVPPGSGDADFYKIGTLLAPTLITDAVYRTGDVAIGLSIPLKKLHVLGNTREEYQDVDGYYYKNDFGNQADIIYSGAQTDAIARSLYLDSDNYFAEVLYNTDGTNSGGTGGFAPAKIMSIGYSTMSGPIFASASFSGVSDFVYLGGPSTTATSEHTNTSITNSVSSFITGEASSTQVGPGISTITSSGFAGQGSARATPDATILQYENTAFTFQGSLVLNGSAVYGYALNPITQIQTEIALTEASARLGYNENGTNVANKFSASAFDAQIYAIDALGQSARVIAIQNTGAGLPGIKLEGIPEYADNAAASLAGLTLRTVYRTGDLLKIVH